MQTHLREPDDRRRGQREGAFGLHGPFEITVTLDRYGHLMPGNEREAAELLDGYLERDRQSSTVLTLLPEAGSRV